MARILYIHELEAVRHSLIQMGENTAALLGEALHAIAEHGSGSAERASELEAKTDHQLRTIRDQCLSLITLQAPVARDARLITGILDAIVDLELIGDYAYEIVTIGGSAKQWVPRSVMSQISEVGSRSSAALCNAIDAWRSEQGGPYPPVGTEVAAIRAECRSLYDKLSQLASGPGDAMPYVNLMLICRHLERISRHAACVAEQAASAAPARYVQ